MSRCCTRRVHSFDEALVQACSLVRFVEFWERQDLVLFENMPAALKEKQIEILLILVFFLAEI